MTPGRGVGWWPAAPVRVVTSTTTAAATATTAITQGSFLIGTIASRRAS
jgi:hypothetical protein